MNKSLLIIALGVTLAGCSGDMGNAKQNYACKDSGGVYRYSMLVIGKVECMNGEHITWNNLLLTPEYYPDKDKE